MVLNGIKVKNDMLKHNFFYDIILIHFNLLIQVLIEYFLKRRTFRFLN